MATMRTVNQLRCLTSMSYKGATRISQRLQPANIHHRRISHSATSLHPIFPASVSAQQSEVPNTDTLSRLSIFGLFEKGDSKAAEEDVEKDTGELERQKRDKDAAEDAKAKEQQGTGGAQGGSYGDGGGVGGIPGDHAGTNQDVSPDSDGGGSAPDYGGGYGGADYGGASIDVGSFVGGCDGGGGGGGDGGG